MTLVQFPDTLLSMSVRGRFGRSAGYGAARRGDAAYGLLDRAGGIYQRHRTVKGWGIVKMKPYRPTNPQTLAQQAWRSQLTAAMAAWSALTTDQKAQYSRQARSERMLPHNLFVRRYLQGVRS